MKFVAMMEMERNRLARETMVQDEGCNKGPPPLRGGPSDKLPIERCRTPAVHLMRDLLILAA